jgi:MFS family permease
MPAKKLGARFGRLIAPYRGLGPSLWSMFFATMINRFGDFVGTLLAIYLTRVQGYDAVAAAGVVSATAAVSMVGALASGRLADAFGRKRVLAASYAAIVVLDLVLSAVFAQSWAVALIVASSLFRGAARPLIGAILTDLAPADKRKEAFGLQYWSINVGVAIGPPVAFALYDHALGWLFRGEALCVAAALLLILRGAKPPAKPNQASSLEKHDERGALAAYFGRPILVAFFGVNLLSSLTYCQTSFGLQLTVANALGPAGANFFGWMMSLNAVMVLAFSIPIARLLRSRSPLECLTLSGLFYVVGFGLLALPGGRWLFALSTVIWTTGEIVASVNMGVFMAKHSPANWRGSFQSFNGVAFSAGWALGPLFAGPLLSGGGGSTLWVAAAGLCAAWALYAALLEGWDRRIVPAAETAPAA